jgi:hypothetical protein
MNKKDIQLINEAYNTVHRPNQIIAEARYIWNHVPISQLGEVSSPEVLEEIWSGLKSIAQTVGQSAAAGGKALGQSIASGAQAAKKYTTAAGKGISAAASQVGSNVKDIYKTGEAQAHAQQRQEVMTQYLSELEEMIGGLIDELTQAGHSDIVKRLGSDPKNITIQQLQDAVNEALKSKEAESKKAKQTGFFGGAKQAFKKGFSTP